MNTYTSELTGRVITTVNTVRKGETRKRVLEVGNIWTSPSGNTTGEIIQIDRRQTKDGKNFSNLYSVKLRLADGSEVWRSVKF